MARYSERSYSPSKALKNIGAGFWSKYQSDLYAYAKDRSRTDILDKIHAEWDGFLHRPGGTDIRIEWAVALYEHGDWPDSGKRGEDPIPTEPVEKPSPPIVNTSSVAPPKPANVQDRPAQARQSVAKKEPKPAIKKKCSNCRFAKNPEKCGHGMFGPCEDWVEATEAEEWWPTWDDMKRAEYEDYKSRYREL